MIKYLPTKSVSSSEPSSATAVATAAASVFADASVSSSTNSSPFLKGYSPQYSFKKNDISETSSETSSESPSDFFEVPIWSIPKPSTSKIYNNRSEFVLDLSKAYTQELKRRGIDTAYVKYLVAQDALESAWGTKYAGNYNFGNITVPKNSNASYTEGSDHDGNGNPITQRFRNYDSMDEWVRAKVDLLSNSRYKAFTGDNSAKAFYTRIKQGGYATDPNYVNKLIKISNSSILNTFF